MITFKQHAVPQLVCKYFDPDEETKLHMMSDTGAMYGTIGKTACCGSASVFGMRIYPENILDFLKDSRCSIVILNGHFFSWSAVNFKEFEELINRKHNKMFTVTITQLDPTRLLVLVDVVDPLAYMKWMRGR